MLAKESRLNKTNDIVRTIRYGRRIRTPYVLLYVLKPDPAPSKAKVAVVVGKKVHKLAVKRHKYQRWLREIAQEVINDIPPFEMVWLALPPLKEVSSKQDLKKSLDSVVEKLQALS